MNCVPFLCLIVYEQACRANSVDIAVSNSVPMLGRKQSLTMCPLVHDRERGVSHDGHSHLVVVLYGISFTAEIAICAYCCYGITGHSLEMNIRAFSRM